MNYPPNFDSELLNPKEDLHELAGLTYSGTDEDGLDVWVGTKQEWDNYEKLLEEEDNN